MPIALSIGQDAALFAAKAAKAARMGKVIILQDASRAVEARMKTTELVEILSGIDSIIKSFPE